MLHVVLFVVAVLAFAGVRLAEMRLTLLVDVVEHEAVFVAERRINQSVLVVVMLLLKILTLLEGQMSRMMEHGGRAVQVGRSKIVVLMLMMSIRICISVHLAVVVVIWVRMQRIVLLLLMVMMHIVKIQVVMLLLIGVWRRLVVT